MSTENKELIELGYAAFAAGDGETVMNLFADDIEWIEPGRSAVSGTHRGKAAVAHYLMKMAEKGVTVRLLSLVAEGDVVVALTEVRVGGEIAHGADVFTIRDGQAVRVRAHPDTRLIEHVFGTG